MLDDTDFYKMIQKKVVDHAEAVVLLFEDCNLSCLFCPQNHNSKQGASREEIMEKVPGLVEFINKTPSDTVYLHIMGGELFQDKLIARGFLDYYGEFIDKIRTTAPQSKKLVFNFVTNLVMDNIDAVIEFCDTHELKMSVSYDSNGRFNKAQLAQYKHNIEKFEKYVELISLVMTKQNIHTLLNGRDTYVDHLYARHICSWDKMLPSTGFNEHLMPAESELLAFYKLLADKYPKCTNMDSFMSSEPSTMTCTRGNSYTVLPDSSIPKGCSGTVLINEAKAPKELGTTIIIQKYMSEKNCFQCDYYSRCSFSCFINNEYKNMVRDIDGCVFKEVFKYVDAKKKK